MKNITVVSVVIWLLFLTTQPVAAGIPFGWAVEIGQFQIQKALPLNPDAIRLLYDVNLPKGIIDQIVNVASPGIIIIATKVKTKRISNFKKIYHDDGKGWHWEHTKGVDVGEWEYASSPKPRAYLLLGNDLASFNKRGDTLENYFMSVDFSDCDTVPPKGKCLLPKELTFQPLRDDFSKYIKESEQLPSTP